MRKSLVILLLLSAIACSSSDSREIPAVQRTQLAKLRDRNMQINRECQDLQKQLSNLQSEANWNSQRIYSVATEALLAAGLPTTGDYVVNVDTLKIEKKPRNKSR